MEASHNLQLPYPFDSEPLDANVSIVLICSINNNENILIKKDKILGSSGYVSHRFINSFPRVLK